MKKKPLTNKSGHVRELKQEDIHTMRTAKEVLPEKLLNVLPKRKRGERGPQKSAKKVQSTQRYSEEVLHYFKSEGDGWQTRINEVLLGYIRSHPKHLGTHKPKSSKHSKATIKHPK